jgi:hypothetical protein
MARELLHSLTAFAIQLEAYVKMITVAETLSSQSTYKIDKEWDTQAFI